MAGKPGLTEAEAEVLRALWGCGPATVRAITRELQGRGRRWAYTTVATLLQRLTAKGFVACDASQSPHVYRAAVSREGLLQQRLRDAADELCDGDAAPLVLALVQAHRFTAEELDRFRRLLEEARDAAGRGGPGSPPRARGWSEPGAEP
jgi:predicted transcriptional regulator